MKRDVITIDENKCNGCGLCITNCPEGALQIINGKARLVSDLFCDGLGACIGRCPQNAITIEKRDTEPYDENKVMDNIVKAGNDVIAAHLRHLRDHNQNEYLALALNYLKEKKIDFVETESLQEEKSKCGCAGSKPIDFRNEKHNTKNNSDVKLQSELSHWPVQLHLINPNAPYFKNADLVVVADCVPFAYADFHRKFLKNKALIIFCPKLDDSYEQYVDKLSELFKNNGLKSLSIVHMEVPCCFGVDKIVQDALKKSGQSMIIKEYTISLKGEIV